MTRKIMLVPTGARVGLTSASLGLARAMEQQGVKLQFFKPIAPMAEDGQDLDPSTRILMRSKTIKPLEPLSIDQAESLLLADQKDVLMEKIIAQAAAIEADTEVLVIEGLANTAQAPFANDVNYAIAKSLDADVVFIATPQDDTPKALSTRLEILYKNWGGKENARIMGAIINKIGAPTNTEGRINPDLSDYFDPQISIDEMNALLPELASCSLKILAGIPYNPALIAPRAADLAKHLQAHVLNAGELDSRRLRHITFCARSIPNMLQHFIPEALLVTSADRSDVIVAACLAAMNGVKIGALLLTGNYQTDDKVLALCEQAFATGLPVFTVPTNTWQTASNLQRFDYETPADDAVRIDLVQDYVASQIDSNWVATIVKDSPREHRLSPPAFRYQLTQLARAAKKTIVLPEGEEHRTIQAASICAERGIANCILIGNPDEIQRVAEQQNSPLGTGITIIDPVEVRENYVAALVEMRKNKGMTEVVAREQLEDNMVLATMMLANNEVDGIVSGAVNTTANTIRPPLQLIKTAPGSSLVSSVFFMLMPDQVYIYGDCAINPDPTAEQLAEIAIQSAESAIAFGIEPKVAMISYSTGNSGQGSDVEKVREATRLAQEKRPDLMIDGPLQYDAAVMPSVAKSKAPNSPVAGQATVFIFPDLNTGNTTYKAVQRSADLISIGPMLQGMRKPVNDLSRGALVDDIVYTIALTAIQATQG